MKKIILQIAMVLLPLALIAQNEFEKFDVPSATVVNDIFVSGDGHVHLATDKGLLSFDGKNWATVTTKEGLPNNDIKDIAWFDNELYVSTAEKGLAKLEAGKGWKEVKIDAPSDFGFVNYMFPLGSTLLLGTDNGKVFDKSKTSEKLSERPYGPQGLGKITGMGMASSGVFNVVSDKGVLLVATNQNNFQIRIKSDNSPLTSDNVLFGFMDGDVAYDCTDKGITVADYAPPGIPPGISTVTEANSDMPSDQVNHISVDGNRWFVATDKGFAISTYTTNWEVFDKSKSNIDSDNVIKVDLANDKTVWFVTMGDKLVLHKYDKLQNASVDEVVQNQKELGIEYDLANDRVRFKLPAGNTTTDMSLSVLTIEGKSIVNFAATSVSAENTIDLNTTDLSAGTYIVHYSSGNGIEETAKLTIY